MRALVTGATGFIGANLARELLDRGRSVRALVRPSSNRESLAGLDLEIAVGDLRDRESVDAAVEGMDEVYHVAAEYVFWTEDPAAVFESNVEGTKNILEACLAHGVKRAVYTSTVGTIGLGGPSPHDEESPEAKDQFAGVYKRSKLDAERAALGFLARGLPLVLVHPSAPIGPWDRKPTPTGKIIVDFMRGAMPAFLDTGLNIVHVRDVAVGHVLAAEKGRIGERYILGNRNMSLREILEIIGGLTGKRAPRIRIPYRVAYAAGLVSTTIANRVTHKPPAIALESVKMARFHMYFSAAKAVAELGLPQTPAEVAFQDALDWFEERGYFGNLS